MLGKEAEMMTEQCQFAVFSFQYLQRTHTYNTSEGFRRLHTLFCLS